MQLMKKREKGCYTEGRNGMRQGKNLVEGWVRRDEERRWSRITESSPDNIINGTNL